MSGPMSGDALQSFASKPFMTTLVRAKLREPIATGSPTTNGEAFALTTVRLARAGDRALIARVRHHLGIDPLTSGLTDAELAALLVARMGLTTPGSGAG
jgi:hypothetical protein